MGLFTPLVVALLTLVVPLSLYRALQWLQSSRRPPNFPPGPPTLPGLGNIHQIPRERPFLQYDAWAKQYGPIVGLKFGPSDVVLLNDASLIYEFIVKRGAIFAARPARYIAQEHVLPEARHTYSLYLRNDYSRRLRTIMKPFFVGEGLARVAPMQKAAGTGLIHRLLQSGDEWTDHIMRWGVTTPVALLSGAHVEEFGQNWIHDYHISLDMMEELIDPASSPPVDIFPILRWVPSPLAAWKRKAPLARKAMLHGWGIMMALAKKHHDGFPSLIPKLLQQSEDPLTAPEERLSEQDITLLMGGMLDAAVDSSVMTFKIILLALATHLEKQHKAQAEIDSVFGSDQALPDKIDIDRLPYLSACITEAIRWRPVSPLGIPRETVEDVEILGYRIPRGTTVVLNQWTVQQDPAFYDAPDEYLPERFVRDPTGAKEGVSQPGRKALYTFGAGRRECPGKDFFFQNATIALAQVLWAFDVVPDGQLDTGLHTGFTSSVLLKPNPFKVKFVPRGTATREAVLGEKRKADAILKEILA